MANVIKHKRGTSDPTASDLVVGEIGIRTDVGKLFTKTDSGTVSEIAGGGSDIIINTLSSSSATGGGSATFNGSAYRFTLSQPPSVSAQQLLVSIAGVIQKPVAGSGQPSEGFSINGNDIILAAAPATGTDFFILTFKSLGVSEPADNTVTNAKVASNAAIQGSKISPDFGSQNITTTGTLTVGQLNNPTQLTGGNPTFRFKTLSNSLANAGFIEFYYNTSNLSARIRGKARNSSNGQIFLDVENNDTMTNILLVDDAGIDVTGDITSTGNITIADSIIHSGDTDTKIRFPADNTFSVDTAGSQRFKIDSSGNIGINTTSANAKLEIASNHSQLRLKDTDDSKFCLFSYSGGKLITRNNSTSTTTAQFTLDESGRLGIGTISPSNFLEIEGGSTTSTQVVVDGTGRYRGLEINENGTRKAYFHHDATDNKAILNTAEGILAFATGDTERVRIDSSGRLLIGTTSVGSYPKKLNIQGESGSIIHLNNYDTTTYAANTSTAIEFNLNTGNTGNQTGAVEIRAFKENGTNGDNARGLSFYTAGNGASPSERMRIDSSGRVYIGLTSQSVSKLYVSGGSFSLTGSDGNFTGGGNRVFLDHDNNDVRFGYTGGGGSAATKGMRFYHCPNSTGTAEATRITEQGEFRIGHDSTADSATSTDKVHSIGGCNLDGVTSNLARLVMQERQSNWISFKNGSGTHFGTIARSGSGVSYGNNSDYRLKNNVANLTNGIAIVKQLRPVTFKWNDLSGFSKTETHQGFIAHEVQALVSDAVDGEKDGMDIWGDCTDSKGNVTQTHVPESKKKNGETWTKKGEDIHDQQLDTGKLIPILTAALQEAISRIEALEAK